MRGFHIPAVLLATTVFMLGAAGCEEKKPDTPAPAATPTPTPTPTPEPTPEPEADEAPSRPEKIDTELTDGRRTKVEQEFKEAKGFLVAGNLEEKLKANKAISQKEQAVTAFDRMASGKWLLFTGPITNLTESGFDLGITYTPQLPNDPMGMSRQWFPITFSDIKGYDQNQLKAGQMVVVLAKYTGKQAAEPGYELVDLGHW